MSEKIEFQVVVTKDQLTDILEKAGAEAGKTEKKIRGLSDAFGDVGKELGSIKASFIGNLGANLVTKSFDLLSDAFGKVIRDGREFSRAIAEINSTLPATSRVTDNQKKALAELSERFGTSATAQAKGFFEVVSNGVENTATAFNILKAANNAALSGLVDINTATRLITSTFNAYSSSGTTAAEVTDTLVAVTQASGVKFEELAQSMGRVTNIAAQSGVTIGELGGSIAFLNSRSLTSEQAITGLAGVLSDVSKPTKEAASEAARLGLQFNVAALQSKGLVGFLKDVTEKTNGNVASLRQLFADQRSANAVIAIATSEFSKYEEVINKVTNSQGEAARASSTVRESLDFKLDQAKNSFNSLFITIGEKLTPAIVNATNALKLFNGIVGGQATSADEVRNKLQALGAQYNKNIDSLTRLNSQLASEQAIGADSGAAITQKQITDILEKQNQILKERQALRGSTAAPEESAVAADLLGVSDDPIAVAKRKETFAQLLAARTEFDAFNAQRDLEIKAALGVSTQADFEAFLLAEQARIDAKFLFEEQQTKLIADETAKRQAQQAIALKKELELAKSANSEKAKILQAESNEKQRQLQVQGNYIQASANLAGAIAKDGSAASFIIQKAAAVAGIVIQDAQARTAAMTAAQIASIGGPPGAAEALYARSAALITSNTVLASSAVAASAIKGYADGGIIGQGATMGGDNRLASVRDGEVVLNANDQKNLYDAIKSGNFGGGDIVIQVDGREVARAVRNQVRSGFVLA